MTATLVVDPIAEAVNNIDKDRLIETIWLQWVTAQMTRKDDAEYDPKEHFTELVTRVFDQGRTAAVQELHWRERNRVDELAERIIERMASVQAGKTITTSQDGTRKESIHFPDSGHVARHAYAISRAAYAMSRETNPGTVPGA